MKFEGEYLNGKRHDKGKMFNGIWYDTNGNFEYELKEGNGKGKEYYYPLWKLNMLVNI